MVLGLLPFAVRFSVRVFFDEGDEPFRVGKFGGFDGGEGEFDEFAILILDRGFQRFVNDGLGEVGWKICREADGRAEPSGFISIEQGTEVACRIIGALVLDHPAKQSRGILGAFLNRGEESVRGSFRGLFGNHLFELGRDPRGEVGMFELAEDFEFICGAKTEVDDGIGDGFVLCAVFCDELVEQPCPIPLAFDRILGSGCLEGGF